MYLEHAVQTCTCRQANTNSACTHSYGPQPSQRQDIERSLRMMMRFPWTEMGMSAKDKRQKYSSHLTCMYIQCSVTAGSIVLSFYLGVTWCVTWKDKVLATWIRDVIAHDLGRRAPFIDVVAPGCARVLMSARSRSSHALAVSSSFKHILYSSLHRVHYACTHWVSLASWRCGTTFWPRPVGCSVASAVQPVLPSRGRCFMD